AEWVVNCRPLTYIANSERDFTLVRPIDFIIPTLHGHQPPDFMDPDMDADSKEDPDYTPANAEDKFQRRLLKDLELARRLSDLFGKLWREGYLLELSRQFGKKPCGTIRVPEVGDIVLVYEENLPRAHWRYGLVMDLHPSSDGVVREVSVRLSETLHETRRAVNHLYPLKPMLPDSAPNIVDETAEGVPVLMANISFSEVSSNQDKPLTPTMSTPFRIPEDSEAEVVPTRSRPPTPDKSQDNDASQQPHSSEGPGGPSGNPQGSQTRGNPRVPKGPRTPSASPPKAQIINERPSRSGSQEARAQQQYGDMKPSTIRKKIRDRVVINNDDWPMDGDCTTSANAEVRQQEPSSRDSSLSPQPTVRSQIVVPQKNTPKRHAIIPGKGRTDLVPASVALRQPRKALLKLQRQPKTHKLTQVRNKRKTRGNPRAERMDTSEQATTSHSNDSQSAGVITTASSASQTSRGHQTEHHTSFGYIGGNTPATSKQFIDTCFDKVLKLGSKKRIIAPDAPVIPFVDTNIRKDALTYGAQTTPQGRDIPVTFEWIQRVPVEYTFGFAITHFSHPAAQVPLAMLAAEPTARVPTIEECAADNITYDNSYIRGALFGCYPHLAFFTNVGVRHYIKQHILHNAHYRPVGILTGLDFSSPTFKTPWKSEDEMVESQIAAFTDFAKYAVELNSGGLNVIRPLCLILVNGKKIKRCAFTEARQILQRLGLPRAHPIYFVAWEGNPDQAWEWTRHFPRTFFGFTRGFVSRRTDAFSLQFKREIPLENVFLESLSPSPNPDGTPRTSDNILDLADDLHKQVKEDHRHILAVTAFSAQRLFFPQELPPANWHCPPSTQPPGRFRSVGAKLDALDRVQAGGNPPAAGSVAPGGPSARKQKGRKPQSTTSFQKAWTQLEDDGSFADFFKEKMDEFSPHYTTTQEQDITRERLAASAAVALDVTMVDTAIRVDLSGNQRRVSMQQSTSRDIYVMPPPPVPPTMTGTAATSAPHGQSSTAADAAAAPGPTPATPDHVAHRAPAAPVPALDQNPWNPHDVALPTQIQPR
ncbi:RNase H and integrase-like protein, partial [Aphelenchoides avenae]